MPKFRVTYEIITPESAEHRDAEERGFVGPRELHQEESIEMSLREAVDLMGCVEDSGSWFSETDGRQDYRTGAEERRAMHPPERITASSYGRLKRLLQA